MAFSQIRKKFYVSQEVANTDLNQSQFEALTWVEVKGVGSVGETGTITNVISYDTLATEVRQKAKGISDAGDPDIECERIAADPGQILLRAACDFDDYDSRAFKFEFQDGSVQYLRGLVMGPRRPGGGPESFELEVFTLGLQQPELLVAPPT
jgi:hypothetical protein